MYHDLRKPAKSAWQFSEEQLQKSCAEWMKKALLAANLPQELFWHVPSEGDRKPQYRAKLKLMGFRPGIPDVCLMLPSDEYKGAFCELKKAGNCPSKEQKTLLEALALQGYFTCVINDLQTFTEVFAYYIDNHKHTP